MFPAGKITYVENKDYLQGYLVRFCNQFGVCIGCWGEIKNEDYPGFDWRSEARPIVSGVRDKPKNLIGRSRLKCSRRKECAESLTGVLALWIC